MADRKEKLLNLLDQLKITIGKIEDELKELDDIVLTDEEKQDMKGIDITNRVQKICEGLFKKNLNEIEYNDGMIILFLTSNNNLRIEGYPKIIFVSLYAGKNNIELTASDGATITLRSSHPFCKQCREFINISNEYHSYVYNT